MAKSDADQIAKRRARLQFQRELGPLVQASRRSGEDGWWTTRDGRTAVFFSYSVLDPPFYGVTPGNMVEGRSFSRAFYIFIMGSSPNVMKGISNMLVVPLTDLLTVIEGTTLVGGGQFKLHVEEQFGKYHFMEAPLMEITRYLNNLDQLTKG